MIVLDMEQRSEAWFEARLGIPTSSRFKEIITAKTWEPSKSAFKYMCRCLAEHMLGESIQTKASLFMERGRNMENEALRWYEVTRGCEIRRVGLCLRDDRAVACSPDGFVGEDGMVEIKILEASNHLACWLRPEILEDDHRQQAQGGMWITGRKWCDLIAYNPDLPKVVVRVERDDVFISALETCVNVFVDELRGHLIKEGYIKPDIEDPTPALESAGATTE